MYTVPPEQGQYRPCQIPSNDPVAHRDDLLVLTIRPKKASVIDLLPRRFAVSIPDVKTDLNLSKPHGIPEPRTLYRVIIQKVHCHRARVVRPANCQCPTCSQCQDKHSAWTAESLQMAEIARLNLHRCTGLCVLSHGV